MTKAKSKKKTKLTSEIELPQDVNASYDGLYLIVNGPKGESRRHFMKTIVKLNIQNKKIILESEKPTKENKKMMGTLAAHIKNMVKGSLNNHNYILKICSGHFPMTVGVADNRLQVKNFLGEKVPRVLELKKGATVKIEGGLINVSSPSKEIAGQVAADIEQLTRRPGYDTRVFQDGIYIINKDGKELK